MGGGANEGRNWFLPRVDKLKGNFLLRLDGNNFTNELPEGVGMHSDDVELNLGLSLGGRFSVKEKAVGPSIDNFFWSPSFPSFMPLPPPGLPKIPMVTPFLVRTCLLRVESEEEQRQRKELQALTRLEAKRRRIEKMNAARARASRSDQEKSGGVVNAGEKKALLPVIIGGTTHRFTDGGQHVGVGGRKLTAPRELLAWPNLLVPKVEPVEVPPTDDDVLLGFSAPPNSSDSTESSSAPPTRKFGGLATKGNLASSSGNHGEAYYNFNNNVVAALSLASELGGRAPVAVAVGEQPLKEGMMDNGTKEPSRRIMEKMPSVTYIGDGSNGRKVDGFLYKYKNGGLNIVCLCHGTFFTPVEFIRHAEGDDVENPLKYIIVGHNSTPWN